MFCQLSLQPGKILQHQRIFWSLNRNASSKLRRLELKDGDRVRVCNEFGEIVVPCKASKGDELPEGLLFIAYGDMSSRLMGGETHCSGMPDSKGLDVLLEKVAG